MKKSDKEIKEYREWICGIFGVEELRYLPEAVLECVLNHKTDIYDKYLEKYPDLNEDSLREFFEDYFEDQKLLMQDFTPECISQLATELVGAETQNEILDECAGIGSLIIPAWSKNHDITVFAREISTTTLPFLLFNLAIRNMEGIVVRGDTLTLKTQEVYTLQYGADYSYVKKYDWDIDAEGVDPLTVIRALMLDRTVTRIANDVAAKEVASE